MQSNSDDSVCSLTNSLSNDVVINVFDGAALGTELVLLSRQAVVRIVAFLVLFDVVSQVLIVVLSFLVFILLLTSSCDDPASLSVLEASAIE